MFVDIFKTGKRYKVIYADPPWEYHNKRTGGSMNSGAANQYPIMDINKILALPLDKIANRDSVLFLWGTVPLLPEALCVLEGWGFEYKTLVVWRKIMSLGLGFWFRGQVELCLLGVRGDIKPFRLQRANLVQTKALKHSQKPEEMRQLIEATGLEPRIELFARKKTEGWDCWGNEVS